MPNTYPMLGAGAKLGYLAVGGTGAPTNLAKLKDIQPGDITDSKVDVSNHDSANRTKEYIEGWLEYSDSTAEIEFNPTDYATIAGFITSRTRKQWVITFSDGSTLVYSSAMLTKISPALPLDKEMTMKVAFALTIGGSVTFTAGS